MQTRKRAQSASFGNKVSPAKDKLPKEVIIPAQPEVKVEEPKAEGADRIEETKDTEEPKEAEGIAPMSNVVEADPATEAKEDEKERSAPSAFYVQDSHIQTSERTHKKRRSIALFFFIVAFITFILGLGGMVGAHYLLQNKADILKKFNPSPTPTIVPMPVEKKEEPVDVSKYKIKVLNGSDISGEAGRLKAKLAAAGFTVNSVGNADKNDYVKTSIAAKASVSANYLKKLEKELGASYVLEKVSKLSTKESVEDVVITIGSEKAK